MPQILIFDSSAQTGMRQEKVPKPMISLVSTETPAVTHHITNAKSFCNKINPIIILVRSTFSLNLPPQLTARSCVKIQYPPFRVTRALGGNFDTSDISSCTQVLLLKL